MRRHHPGATLTPDALEALRSYSWPGNVRELRNVLTRAVVMSGLHISASHLAFNPWSFEGDEPKSQLPAPPEPIFEELPDPEREALEAALREADGNRAQAARILGIPRSSLLYKLAKYGMMRR